MNQVAKSRRFRGIVLALILFGFMYSYAQSASGPKRSVEAKLTVLNPVVCAGSYLKLRMDVTNITNEPIALNRNYFWNTYGIYPSAKEDEWGEKEIFLTHIWPVSRSEDMVTLAGGESYVSHRYFSLRDDIEGSGLYNIDIAT